jgi:hypothetical protein
MPLIDGVRTFFAAHAPEIRREMRGVLAKQDLLAFCEDFNLPMFKVEGIPYKDPIEKKQQLNVLFTWFSGLWIMAFDDVCGGGKDGH